MFNSFKIKKNKGMSYVELIVVLSIMSILTSISMYNYNSFKDKILMKNLANDIGLKIVEAKKSSISGKIPNQSIISSWKPSYGIYFDLSDNKSFYYFVDTDNNNFLNSTVYCGGEADECINKISLEKDFLIESIKFFNTEGVQIHQSVTKLNILFKRPNQTTFVYNEAGDPIIGFNMIEITLSKSSNEKSKVLIYQSGRIKIN